MPSAPLNDGIVAEQRDSRSRTSTTARVGLSNPARALPTIIRPAVVYHPDDLRVLKESSQHDHTRFLNASELPRALAGAIGIITVGAGCSIDTSRNPVVGLYLRWDRTHVQLDLDGSKITQIRRGRPGSARPLVFSACQLPSVHRASARTPRKPTTRLPKLKVVLSGRRRRAESAACAERARIHSVRTSGGRLRCRATSRTIFACLP